MSRMSDRRRNLFMIGLFIFIVVGIFFFGRFLSPSDLNVEQPPVRRTITAIVGANQTTEAQIHQTETAGSVGDMWWTVTPTPIPYTADMSPTALPPPSYTPTLCPPSDVVCPGGNATASAGQQVLI